MSDIRAKIGGTLFMLAADAVIIRDGKVLLLKRSYPPFEGMWELPGGIVKIDEAVAEAAKREAKEEAGVDVEIKKLVGIYDAPGRDPRGRVISIAFLCTAAGKPAFSPREATDARWFPLDSLPKLAADHNKIVGDAIALLSPKP